MTGGRKQIGRAADKMSGGCEKDTVPADCILDYIKKPAHKPSERSLL